MIYNSRVPASKAVAEHYAAARQVPAKQMFGFALTTNEIITRADFTDFLQKPLAAQLEAAGLWKFGKAEIAANGNAAGAHGRAAWCSQKSATPSCATACR